MSFNPVVAAGSTLISNMIAGPFNERAEVGGTITDPTERSFRRLPSLCATLRRMTRARRIATTPETLISPRCLQAVTGCKYRWPGFEVLSGDVTVQARDRAFVSATLNIGSVDRDRYRGGCCADHAIRGAQGRAGRYGRRRLLPQCSMDEMAADVEITNAAAVKLPVEGRSFGTALKADEPAAPHVRSYFPEALYINPEIITDAKGNAEISIPIADSITTWRMAMLASTQAGALGTGTASLKVFQDFFADLDLPVTLTQGDRVSIPVAIYNYSGKPGEGESETSAGRLVLARSMTSPRKMSPSSRGASAVRSSR